MEYVSRIIFNFTNKCNLSCDFCYIPFNNEECKDLDLWKNIIDKCKSLNAKIITFGGGDPFMYKDFYTLLEYTYDGKIFIQVDTNALGLTEKHLNSINSCVDLVSLPVDGTELVHSKMRKNTLHYQVVMKWLKRFNELGIPVKINTVLTKYNYSNLYDLAQILNKYIISKWSIYQYWALGPLKHNRVVFELTDDEYFNITSNLMSNFSNLNIEQSSLRSRYNSYFFVTQTSRVYVMDKKNQEEYVELGSIFDQDIIKKWKLHGNFNDLMHRANKRIN